MSEDNQWRQLGSIVNAVLTDTRTKAIRRGALYELASHDTSRNISQKRPTLPKEKRGNGFLSPEAPVVRHPTQLELALGIATPSQTGFESARAPRNARLM